MLNIAQRRMMFLAVLVPLVGACSEKDTTAPPPPFLETLRSPTSLPTQWIEGSAEYGATVRIEGGAAAVEVVADPYTARFRAEITLLTTPDAGSTSVDNVLTITATDNAEKANTSEPVTDAAGNKPVITYQTPRAEGLTLELSTHTVSADDGRLTATAQITNDELLDLAGFDVTFEVTGLTGVVSQTIATDAAGMAVALFDELRTVVAEATISATADTNPAATATNAFRVIAGEPAVLDLVLFNTTVDPSLAAPLVDPIQMGVGEELAAEMTVTDAFGNMRNDATTVASNLPGATHIGMAIIDITVTGSYKVAGSVLGRDVAHVRNVEVGAGAPAMVLLEVTPAQTRAGDTVTLSAMVVDAFGNNTGDTPTLASSTDLSGHSECSLTEGFLTDTTFRTCHSGNTTITASFTGATDGTATLGVDPGAAADLSSFALTGAAADGAIDAGEDVTYSYAALDAFGNNVAQPVTVVVNFPDGVVLDDGFSGAGTITGLTRASATPYTITARIGGSAVTESHTVTVGVSTGQRTIDTALSLSSMAINDTVIAFSTVRDIYGNLITAPLPTYSVAASDGSDVSGAYALANGNEITITTAGVYRITGTFDDSVNSAATDAAFILVENVPDLSPPSPMRITHINGVAVCTTGTLIGYPSTDCNADTPDLTIGRRSPVLVEVSVDDDRGLASISYKAFGSGVSADDFILIGAGQHTPGTPMSITFFFSSNNTAIPGDVNIVASASDTAGNVSNSAAALLRVDLGISISGDRTFTTVVGGDLFGGVLLSDPRGLAVNPAGDIFIANRDFDQAVYQVSGQAVLLAAALVDEPEFIAFDSNSNMYVGLRNGTNDVIQVQPDGTQVLYVDGSFFGGMSDPDGLSVIDGGTPGTGRFRFTGGVNDGNSVTIGGVVYEFDSGGGTACGGGEDFCVAYDGSLADAMDQLVIEINTRETAVTARRATDCDDTTRPCVMLVATASGTAGLPIALAASGAITPTDVDNGQNADLLYVGDQQRSRIFEYQIPNDPGVGELNSYQMGQTSRGIATYLTADNGRLVLFSVDDGTDELVEFDTGTGTLRTVADQGGGGGIPGGLDRPYDVVIRTSTDPLDPPTCALVANDGGNGDIIAYDLRAPGNNEMCEDGTTACTLDATCNGIGNGYCDPASSLCEDATTSCTPPAACAAIGGGSCVPGYIQPEIVASGFASARGIALEGADQAANLLITDRGYNMVLRIEPTPAGGDCL